MRRTFFERDPNGSGVIPGGTAPVFLQGYLVRGAFFFMTEGVR